MEQAGIPGDRVQNTRREGAYQGSQHDVQTRSAARERHDQQQQREGGVLWTDRGHEHGGETRTPGRDGAGNGGTQAERERDQERRGRHELGHRLVREAHQFVPEGAGDEGDARSQLAEANAREEVHACRDQQRDRTGRKLDAIHIPRRLTEPDAVERQQQSGNEARDQPRARAVVVLPVHDPVTERQPVSRLQVLHDLVRMQHEVPGKRDGRARREGEQENQREEHPWPLRRRCGVQ